MGIHPKKIKPFILRSYGALLVALLALILLQPTVDTRAGKYLLEVVFIAILFGGLHALEKRKSLLRFEGLLLLVSLALYAAGIILKNEDLFFLGVAGRIIFMALIALIILINLFRSQKVSEDTLAGAVCVYLLIALVWGHCYMLIEFLVPGSFSFTTGEGRMALWVSREFYPFYYFSLVTMTTIGYGDMVPVSTAARTFATIEGVLGQVYLTILVARLVGMHLMQQQEKGE
ncbi:MAG: potassium channel family protein [Desulfuromonadales bacterium]